MNSWSRTDEISHRNKEAPQEMRDFLDTNVLVAAVVQNHARALPVVQRSTSRVEAL